MEPPLAVIDCDWNNTVVIAGRMVHAAGISFILPAEQALRISALFSQFGCCDSFRIFLRFGQINRNVQIAVFSAGHPFHILADAVSSDIIGILAQFIVIIRSRL